MFNRILSALQRPGLPLYVWFLIAALWTLSLVSTVRVRAELDNCSAALDSAIETVILARDTLQRAGLIRP